VLSYFPIGGVEKQLMDEYYPNFTTYDLK